jgi:hypothetical protein
MREYRINMSMWGISRWAYEELRAFCRRYPEMKAEAAALLGVKSSSHVVEYTVGTGGKKKTLGTVMARGNATSNPVEDTIIKRMLLLEGCDLIDRVAAETDGGEWKEALILNCCYGKGYELLDPAILPTSKRNAFFEARREFFYRLNCARIAQRRKGTNDKYTR